jgi:hypothetical protein
MKKKLTTVEFHGTKEQEEKLMKIESASYQNGCLILTTSDPEARRFAYEFESGEYTVKKAKKRRSLDSNAYAWVLLDKLSERLNISKEELYREYIRNIGGVSETVCVKENAVDKLREAWQGRGLGWQTETFPSKIEGCTNVILYYGSSTYDSSQMKRLLDLIRQDCAEQGIEYATPDEIARMMSLWESR